MQQETRELLTVDYGQNTVIYLGASLPSGTIGCEALNVPEEILSAMEAACRPLEPALQAIQNRSMSMEMLTPAKAGALKVTALLEEAFPSMKGKTDTFRNMVDKLFSRDGMSNAIAYIKAAKRDGPISVTNPQYRKGVGLLKLIPTVMQLPGSLRLYQERMIPFVQALQEGTRTPKGYAITYAAYFPDKITFDPHIPGWEQMMNVTMQYTTIEVLKKNAGSPTIQIAVRMNHATFVGMFRADLYEGLRVGHAPKKCAVCGKWFLTRNARDTKYCKGLAPGDPFGRTCCQVGAQQNRELAADDPVHQVYTRAMNNLYQLKHREHLTEDQFQELKGMAQNRKQRVKEDRRYSMEQYELDMKPEALLAEVAT